MTNNIRKSTTTTLNVVLMKHMKMLAIELDKNVNDLLEEGMIEVLKKYGKSIELAEGERQ